MDSSHIEFVFDCLSKNTSEIRNIKKYLLAMLFNAPSTINGYYAAPVSYTHLTRKMVLAARQEVLGETYVRALEILCSMPREDYLAPVSYTHLTRTSSRERSSSVTSQRG